MKEILTTLIAKNNELESMKKYITDETALNIIKAKQDTLEDVYDLINNKWTSKILAIGD